MGHHRARLCVSGNFLIHVLLIRWLGGQSYGAFVVSFSAYLLVLNIYNGLIVEPLLVFMPGRFKGQGDAYLRTVLAGHWRVSLGISCTGAAAALLILELVGLVALRNAFAGLAIAAPGMLFFVLMRRVCYARFQMRLAALSSAGYLLLTLGGATLLRASGQLSLFSAYALLGAASLAIGYLMSSVLAAGGPRSDSASLSKEVAQAHWDFGKWAVPSGIVKWIPLNAWYLTVP